MKVRKSWMCKCTWLVSSQRPGQSGCPPALPTCPSDSPRPIGIFPESCVFKLFIPPPLSACLSVSRCLDAEVHFINMTALTRGRLHSSFWIVDRKHIYIGSADMDWRSFSKVTTNINMSVQSKIRTEDIWASAVRRGQVCSSLLASKWLQRSLRNKSWMYTNLIKW